jgi:hypothetical protein
MICDKADDDVILISKMDFVTDFDFVEESGKNIRNEILSEMLES